MGFVHLHLHDDHSLLDSCTKFEDYVKKAKEWGHPAIACTNHGVITNWTDKKILCDSLGIKYIHGCEVYLTARKDFSGHKIRDNYHTILLAKNNDGIKELNNLVSKANKRKTGDTFFYKPRITFDEFLSIGENIISLSACLAGVLSRIDADIEKYLESENQWEVDFARCLEEYRDRLFDKYTYYEIQPHNTVEQVNLNYMLWEEAKARGKKLVATNDVHSLNAYKQECRKKLMDGKRITFGDGEYDFDLTFKSEEEMVGLFRKQKCLPDEEIINAINNTIEVANSVEWYELDRKIKYPHISDNDEDVFKKKLREKFYKSIGNGRISPEEVEEFKKRLRIEYDVFKQVDMITFMLSMSDLITWCKDNNISVGPGRGSVGGCCTAYVMDITDIDPVKWGTVFSRFCNEFRVEIGDIDIDVYKEDRDKVFQHCIDTFGVERTAFVLALGTAADKAAIEDICRGLGISVEETKKVKELWANDSEKARKKYPKVFYYYDGICGTCTSQSRHPAGIVISPITLDDNYGTLEDKDGNRMLQLDMDAIHEVGLAKYDLLSLRNLGTISETYKIIGKPFPRMCDMDWNDQKVWKDILSSPIGIFQMESPFAFQTMCKFQPKSIFDMSLVTAMIRPSGASYRDELVQKNFHKNPSEEIDNLLKESYGFLTYQEQVIAFLQDICGLSGGEADNIRRAIGRKDKERLDKAMPKILEGYCNTSKKDRETAEGEAKEFLKVIEDASSYMFNKSHSIAYCLVGYICAYLRCYYPLEFLTASLNTVESEKDISDCTALAKQLKIKILPAKFRYSSSKYYMDKENNSIYKGVSSIKYMSDTAAEYLYSLKEIKYNGFIDFLKSLDTRFVDTRQISLLIKLNYFQEFGNINYLLAIFDFYQEFGKSKHVMKSKLSEYPMLNGIFMRNCRETEKKYMDIEWANVFKEVEGAYKVLYSQDASYQEQAQWQKEYLGYVDFKTNKDEDRTRLFVEDVTALKRKADNKVWAYSITTISIGSGKRSELVVLQSIFDKNPISVYNIIRVNPNALRRNEYNGRSSWRLMGYIAEG